MATECTTPKEGKVGVEACSDDSHQDVGKVQKEVFPRLRRRDGMSWGGGHTLRAMEKLHPQHRDER
jgi:hypothetical protein